MISFSDVSKQYGRQVIFVDASFQLNPGEKAGLVGPNGAGKTTLFRMIKGEESADDGVFAFDLTSYRRDFERMIDSGEMPSFWEGELWRETRRFDNVAHVLSAYETRRNRAGEVVNRGVNSIQLFRRGDRWWISAMIWRREGATVRIPDDTVSPPADNRA